MIKIAHLSDLHFGMKEQEKIWTSLSDYINNELKPHITLITGDIVDTPRKSLYTTAKEALDRLRSVGAGAHYVLCPGNHDRHFRGNALGHLKRPLQIVTPNSWIDAWFDNAFAGLIATPGQSFAFDLDDRSGGVYNVRVLGLDSSAHARYSAQGFAEKNDLEILEATARSLSDANLVIVLTHHHLLPIAALEKTKQSAGGLFSPTIMLNAGTMLESLARSSVNLVLHGHEHHRAVARYRMPRERGAEIVIVGAGSATGADTREGCAFERASANLFELHPDRSVFLREIRWNRNRWEISARDPEDLLLSSRAVREARFYRRSSSTSKAMPTSQVLKCPNLNRIGCINHPESCNSQANLLMSTCAEAM
jgi:UDP-2,3-diacylglucosamine pyrophosphatase LpxH